MDEIKPGTVTDYSIHTSQTVKPDPWAGKPASERPAKPQVSNVPAPDPHISDPWNKPFD